MINLLHCLLFVNIWGTTEHGTFIGAGGEWTSKSGLTNTDDTIRVVNGEIVP